jgi:hypothetical protein
MTVMYQPPRLKRIGSLHTLPLTHEEGSDAGVGGIPALYGSPVSDTP